MHNKNLNLMTISEAELIFGTETIQKLILQTPQMTGAKFGQEIQWVEYNAAIEVSANPQALLVAYYYQLADDLLSTDCLENLPWIPVGVQLITKSED